MEFVAGRAVDDQSAVFQCELSRYNQGNHITVKVGIAGSEAPVCLQTHFGIGAAIPSILRPLLGIETFESWHSRLILTTIYHLNC